MLANELVLPARNWTPRIYQMPLWRYLEGGGKRAVSVWHRRSGKDEVGLNWTAVAAHKRAATYWYLLPQASQARKAVWTAINPHTGIKRIDEAFPEELRTTTRNNEMSIEFKVGSTFQVVGSDNFDSLVGSPPAGVVFSEWSLSDPQSWAYIRPILTENGGWALFNLTPRGRNHAKLFFENAVKEDDWFADKVTAKQSGVFTDRQLINEERQYIQDYGLNDGKARFRQEYLCDFEAAISGSYYAHEMQRAEEEKRILRVMWEPSLPVHTAWDIGFRDSTTIWFCQVVRDEVRLLDYIENSGVAVPWYVNELRSRPYAYGTHLLPHDAAVGQITSGTSVKETLAGLGVHATIVPQAAIYDGINAARQLLPRCFFDETKCQRGIEVLRNYRREWDEKRKVFHDKPLHDWASHGADAFRYLAMGLPSVSASNGWDKPLKYANMGVV
jgi:phage terminase large subunit